MWFLIISVGLIFISEFWIKSRKPDIAKDDKKSSRIQLSILVDGYDNTSWEQHFKWHLQNIERLEKAFKPLIGEAYKALNNIS